MALGLAFLTLIAAGAAQPASAKTPPPPPTPCAHPMLRLAADQPEARKQAPATPRAPGDRNPPCAILQKWSSADAWAPSPESRLTLA